MHINEEMSSVGTAPYSHGHQPHSPGGTGTASTPQPNAPLKQQHQASQRCKRSTGSSRVPVPPASRRTKKKSKSNLSHLGVDGRVRRPMNAFMLWSKTWRKKIAQDHPDIINANISKLLGKIWKEQPAEIRQKYVDESQRLREEHKSRHPEFRYTMPL